MTPESSTPAPRRHVFSERNVRIGIGGVGGVLLLVGAVYFVLRPLGDLLSAVIWFTVPAVLSDLLVLPVVAVVGAFLTSRVPAWFRLPVQVGLVAIAVLTAIALPFLGRPGLHPDNPTLLNRNYLGGWAVYVALILMLCGGWATVRRAQFDSGKLADPEE